MAITDIYQDLIMNPENMPNRLQNLEMFPPVDNIPGRFDAFYDSTSNQEIPGFNFVDAPIETSFFKRMTDPNFMPYRNNPRTGIIDNLILSRGNPEASLINKTKNKISDVVGAGKSGLQSLAQFLPFGEKSITGALLRGITSLLPERDYRQNALEDFYGSVQDGTIQSGLMAGYNPVSGGLFGKPVQYGLSPAIDRRIARIQKTLQKKDSETLRQRVKALEELKKQEAAVLREAAIADNTRREQSTIERARQANPDVYRAAERQGFIDSRTGGFKSTGTNEAFSNKTGRGRTGY